MRERIHFNDLSTLVICPSRKWKTLERKAIADCLYLRDCGGNPTLFCLKNSKIDRVAKNLDLPRIYYSGRKLKRFFDFRYIRDMKNIIKQNSFDIIHCYHLEFLWGICFVLMSNPRIPLLLTFNHYPKVYGSLWNRWLFRRVDLVIVFCQTTKEIVQECLPVSLRKIKISGAGVEAVRKLDPEESPLKVVGMAVHSTNDLDKVLVAVYALSSLLKSAHELGVNVRLNIYATFKKEVSTLEHPIFQLVADLNLEEQVRFLNVTDEDKALKELSIFVGSAFDEPLNDLELKALVSHIPVVFPRTASRQVLLSKYRWIGESYHEDDARELKSKLLKILINEQVYLNELQDVQSQIEELHGFEPYSQRMSGFYERLYAKRLRLLRQREQEHQS